MGYETDGISICICKLQFISLSLSAGIYNNSKKTINNFVLARTLIIK